MEGEAERSRRLFAKQCAPKACASNAPPSSMVPWSSRKGARLQNGRSSVRFRSEPQRATGIAVVRQPSKLDKVGSTPTSRSTSVRVMASGQKAVRCCWFLRLGYEPSKDGPEREPRRSGGGGGRIRASEALLATRSFRKAENPVRFRADALQGGKVEGQRKPAPQFAGLIPRRSRVQFTPLLRRSLLGTRGDLYLTRRGPIPRNGSIPGWGKGEPRWLLTTQPKGSPHVRIVPLELTRPR